MPNKTRINLYIDPKAAEAMRAAAKEAGQTMTTWLERMILAATKDAKR